MKIKGIAHSIGACLISSSVVAQPLLITELKPGDSWLQTNYSKIKSDYSFSGYSDEATIDTHSFNASFITVQDTSNNFKPTIGFSVNRFSAGDDKVVIRNLHVGSLFELDNERQGFLNISYAKSDAKSFVRDSYNGQLSFEMSEIDSTVKNELSLNGRYYKKFESLSGGHEFNLSNKTKIPFNQKVDLLINIGTTLITKTKLSSNQDINYDAIYSFGGELNIHPSKHLTLQVSALRTEKKGNINSDLNFNQTETQTSIALISRF